LVAVPAYGDTTASVAEALRFWAREGRLSSGEHLRQDDIAQELGVTRVPVREAFKTLVAEGLLVHKRNQGHFVASLDPDELRQIYWMRNVVELELTRTMVLPNSAELDRARNVNERLREVIGKGVRQIVTHNRIFHFIIFGLSPETFLVQEAAHLWDRTDQYRALHLYQPGVAERCAVEHDAMLRALDRGDKESYLEVLHDHRQAAEEAVLRELTDAARATTLS
jgi:DNA-binding GntR family transcriptional regulator